MTTPEISLDPMTDEEFAVWLLPTVTSYAEDNVSSGRCSAEDAVRLAKLDFMTLLPDGPRTKDQHLYTARGTTGGEGVSVLWIHLRVKAGKPEAFIYDLVVHEDQRGKGYGRATMLAGIERARELGADSVGLHVFGNNAVARELYTSLGFRETNVEMSLPLRKDAG